MLYTNGPTIQLSTVCRPSPHVMPCHMSLGAQLGRCADEVNQFVGGNLSTWKTKTCTIAHTSTKIEPRHCSSNLKVNHLQLVFHALFSLTCNPLRRVFKCFIGIAIDPELEAEIVNVDSEEDTLNCL